MSHVRDAMPSEAFRDETRINTEKIISVEISVNQWLIKKVRKKK